MIVVSIRKRGMDAAGAFSWMNWVEKSVEGPILFSTKQHWYIYLTGHTVTRLRGFCLHCRLSLSPCLCEQQWTASIFVPWYESSFIVSTAKFTPHPPQSVQEQLSPIKWSSPMFGRASSFFSTDSIERSRRAWRANVASLRGLKLSESCRWDFLFALLPYRLELSSSCLTHYAWIECDMCYRSSAGHNVLRWNKLTVQSM